MSQKAFVIVRKGFEYNDEIYSEPESGGGTTVHIYTDKKVAEAEMEKLERQEFREAEIGGYCYSASDISDFDEEEIGERLNEIFGSKPSSPRGKRKKALVAELAGALKGKALENAVTAALAAEFPSEKENEFDLSGWSMPSTATDEEVDAVRKVFSGLTFHEIQETTIN